MFCPEQYFILLTRRNPTNYFITIYGTQWCSIQARNYVILLKFMAPNGWIVPQLTPPIK